MDVYDDAHSGCSGLTEFIHLVSRKNLWRREMGSRCITTETKWEEALVQASRDGNDQAIETLFRRYQRQLFATARRILGNTEDAEDALQDGLLSAYRNVARFEGRSKFSTWLTRIVVNAALERRRRAKGLRVTSLDATPPESQVPISECVQDDDPNPEQTVRPHRVEGNDSNECGTAIVPTIHSICTLRHRRAFAGRSRETTGYHDDSNERADASCSMQIGGELRTPARAKEDDVKKPIPVESIAT